MSVASDELERRLGLVSEILARTPDPIANPLDVNFQPFDGAEHEAAWGRFAKLASAGKLHNSWVLYVHLPFCAKVCSYCLLASVKVPGKPLRDGYISALVAQITRMGHILGDLSPGALHVGGGTPTLLTAAELERIFSALDRSFPHHIAAPAGVEAYPSTATRDKLDVLVSHGVERLSLGVESLTPEVLRRANRADQTLARVSSAIDVARAAGIQKINVDMLAGLPGETQDSFESSMRELMTLDFDSLSVNRYIAESSPLASFGYAPSTGETQAADRMLLSADRIVRELRTPDLPTELLNQAGFGSQYVWFQRGPARPYFQQDMIGATSVLALGYGGMGHLHGGGYVTNHGSLGDYVRAAERDLPPDMLLSPSPMSFEMAFHVADQATRGSVDSDVFRAVFRREINSVYGSEFDFLTQRGLLTRVQGGWSKPPNRDFSAAHLIAFLRHSASELTQRLSALPTPKPAGASALEQRRTAGRRELPVSQLPGRQPTDTTPLSVWLDGPGFAAPQLSAEAMLEAGTSQVVLPLGAAAPEAIEADTQRARAWCPQALELSVQLLVADDGLDVARCEAALKAGASRLILDVGETTAELAEQLWRVFARLDVPVEVLKDGAGVRNQYTAVGAEVPPSLLWCRIAMSAAAATRKHRDPGLVRL